MLLINKSIRPHVINIPTQAFPMVVYPGVVFEKDERLRYCTDDIIPFNMESLNKTKIISCIRRYALGDIIQLVPVMRILRKKYNLTKICILTNQDYCNFLKFMYPDIKFFHQDIMNGSNEDFGITFNLDGILERDHNPENPEVNFHRIAIYLKFFGITDYKPEDISFEGKLNMEVVKSINADNLIGLQIRGSGEVKTLPFDFIKKLANKLAEKYRVVLLDHDVNKGFEGPNILNMCGKLNIYECVALLSKLKACITMDSGMLWLAHSAKCPVVTFLGPTREAERLSLHPLYPEKAKAINLNELVNCAPCFETKTQCNKRISCMKDFNWDILIEKTQQTLNTMGV